MKKTILSIVMLTGALAVLSGCGGKEEKKAPAPVKTPSAKEAMAAMTPEQKAALPNYRFIDTDSIMLKYNLSIDFNEQMIRLQNNLADEEKNQRNAIQSKASAVQKKAEAVQAQGDPNTMRSQYEAIQKEYEAVQNMQTQAEQKLSQMGMDLEKTLAANAQTVMDSLNNFLRDYASERGYDAVFIKNSAPYYNPALDVTDEVVEGLNARYNKIKK